MTEFEALMLGRKARKRSEAIACRIAEDMSGRRGFDIADLQEETRREIAEAWVRIIEDKGDAP